MVIKISTNFSLQELTRTDTGLPNVPSSNVVARLRRLANNILEKLREKFGPFTPSSTFRSFSVNKKVGGGPNSQHLQGQASDIVIKGITSEVIFHWIIANLEYDQVIFESLKGDEWVHVSYVGPKANRKQAFRIIDGVVKGA
jgi:zinc D-Ala-D-Ala carboxypeptidase